MCTVPKRSFISGPTSLRYHRGTLPVDRERRHFLSTQHAQRPAVVASRRASSREQTARPVEGLAALAAFTATFTVSLLVWGPAY